jgi:HD superfamily phosphohydrolase
MALFNDFEVVRDPLWNNIRIDGRALGIVDSAPFQRLRYVRQLGHAYLVYPGATHSRFEHALGTYHLARRALAMLRERGELDAIAETDATLAVLAALLHDIGHYPFSHALEEAGLPSHESLARRHLQHPELRDALDRYGIPDVQDRLVELITGGGTNPLRGLVSGSVDLDKIEYLTRDARMCGVPYGTVDVDRLLHSITAVEGPDGTARIGVQEKGLSALESLLFAKYQMYRNVYWHHAVRSATAMFKRVVRAALTQGALSPDTVADSTDESIMEGLGVLRGTELPERLRRRQLFKRATDISAGDLPAGAGDWIAARPALTHRVEDRAARELHLAPGQVLIDFPAKPEMLAVDLPVRTRGGAIGRIGGDDPSGLFGLPRIADELHTSARRLRVFTARSVRIDPAVVVALASRHPDEIETLLAEERPLLGRD